MADWHKVLYGSVSTVHFVRVNCSTTVPLLYWTPLYTSLIDLSDCGSGTRLHGANVA